MTKPAHLHPADFHGVARLAADATGAVTDIVEGMHAAVTRLPFLSAELPSGGAARAGGVPGLAYSSVRTVAGWVGSGLDLALTPLVPLLGPRASTPERDTMISVANGVIGDHLKETGNPLAIPMQLRRRGLPLVLRRNALAEALPRTSRRVAVLIHGLCGTDAQWKRANVDYAVALERDFDFTPIYLRYNSGLHISENGEELAGLLETLVREWPAPVEELLLVGHSMGGLVARSAVHHARAKAGNSEATHAVGQGTAQVVATDSWTRVTRRIAFLGSPHHGAPLERGGHWFEQVIGSLRYAAPLSRLGRLRSAGITDLRHGNLVHEDWHGCDRFAHAEDTRQIVPLPDGIDCLAVAATTGAQRGDARDRLVADGLVPVASALGHHDDPRRELAIDASRRHVIHRANHMALLGHPEVYEHLSSWLSR